MPMLSSRYWAIRTFAICMGALCMGLNGTAANNYVPGKNTALLTNFSGTFFFPTVTLDPIAQMFTSRGYKVETLVRTAWNQVDQESTSFYTVDDFRTYLHQGYGVLFSVGHAGNNGIAVEHFQTAAEAQQRIQDLTTGAGEYVGVPDDVAEFEDAPDEEFVIAITPNFIKDQKVKLANNALVYVNTCNSFNLFNFVGDNNPVTADIPFLYDSVGAVAFLGEPNLCQPDLDQAGFSQFFGTMLAQPPIPGLTPQNYTVGQTYNAMISQGLWPQGQAPVLATRNNDANYLSLRLYNAPRIIRAQVTHPGGAFAGVYSFIYPVFSYPFNQAPYPGDLSHAPMKAADIGPLTINLSFSQPMDTAWPGFSVTLSPTGGGTPLAFSSGKWVRNNTWAGTLNVPPDTTIRDGPATVTVTARDIYQTNNSAGGDLDNDGSGVAEGPNTMISFPISRPNRISLTMQSGRVVLSNVFGTTVPPFNTLETAGTVTILAPNGLQSLNLIGPQGAPLTLFACNPPNWAGASSVTCSFRDLTPASP